MGAGGGGFLPFPPFLFYHRNSASEKSVTILRNPFPVPFFSCEAIPPQNPCKKRIFSGSLASRSLLNFHFLPVRFPDGRDHGNASILASSFPTGWNRRICAFEVPRNNPFTIQCTGLVARNPPESFPGCIICPLLCESLINALIWGVKSDSRAATTDHKPDLYSRSDESHENQASIKKMEG